MSIRPAMEHCSHSELTPSHMGNTQRGATVFIPSKGTMANMRSKCGYVDELD